MPLKIHVEVWLASRILGAGGRTFSKDELSAFVRDKFGDTRVGVSTHKYRYLLEQAGKGGNEGDGLRQEQHRNQS